jgi:predicted Zn-dependent protease
VKSWQSLSLDAEKVGPALRKLGEVDADLAKSVEDVLTAVNGQAESANIFAEIGNSKGSNSSDAYERLSAMAKAAVSEGKAATFEQALVDVATANPDIYAQHLAEGR